MPRERIAVVGVGAIGGAVIADLWDLGRHDIRLCARTPFEALEVRHPGGTSRVTAPVLTEPAGAGPVDWVLLATKAHQSPAAEPWLRALASAGARVVVLQNGIDQVERITPLVAAGVDVVPAVVQIPAEKTAPGRVAQSFDGVLVVPDDAAGRAFAALFDGSRISVVASPDFLTQAWWKLLSNASIGAVTALTLRENGSVGDDEVRDVVLSLMREVAAVGQAAGAALPADAPEKSLRLILDVAPGHWSSITVDRREGRAMEWEVRNAVVGRLGRRYGVPTPLNDLMTTLLRAADAGRRPA